MNKHILKWVLSHMDETVLLQWVTETETKVKGFREITKSNIKKCKPQLIHEMQKNDKAIKLKTAIHTYLEPLFAEDERDSLRNMQPDELLARLADKDYAATDLLLLLLTGEEAEHSALAESLFAALEDQGRPTVQESLTRTPAAANNPATEAAPTADQLAQAEATIRKLQEQIKQEKEKYGLLQTSLQDLKVKRKTEIADWKKERKQYTDDINLLAARLESKSKTCEQQEELIRELKLEISQLKERPVLLNSPPESEPDSLKAVNLPIDQMQSEKPASNKPKIFLLGELFNSSILNTPKYDIELVSTNRLEDFLQSSKQAKEIWMLTFQFSPQKQRKVRNAIAEDQLIEFANLTELQTYLQKS